MTVALGVPALVTAMLAPVAQAGVVFDPSAQPVVALSRIVGLATLSAAAVTIAAVVYRWYFRESIPNGISFLLGVSAAVIYLNTVSLGAVVGGSADGLFSTDVIMFNLLVVAAAAAVAPLGRRVGDRIGTDVFAFSGAKELEGELSRVVRSVGRVTAVTLPETISDIEGYDPVEQKVKDELAEKTLLFPRRLTIAELHERLVARLKDDYGVGHVDVDLTEDATVEYLGVGRRAAGLGPTLAPGDAAVPIRADPAYSASSGDIVQVWEGGEDPERVLTAELRATAADVATIATDASEATKLDDVTQYRLMTLPAEPRADREFASLLRAADETMASIVLQPDSPLVGQTIGDISATVVAVRSDENPVEAIPSRARTLAPGDTIFVIARPETLRQLEEDAETPPPVES